MTTTNTTTSATTVNNTTPTTGEYLSRIANRCSREALGLLPQATTWHRISCQEKEGGWFVMAGPFVGAYLGRGNGSALRALLNRGGGLVQNPFLVEKQRKEARKRAETLPPNRW